MNIPRVLATVGAAGGMGYLAMTYMGDLKTPGMKNIENRHAAAGGGHTHTPSIASKLGDEQDVATRAEKDKGVGTKHFQDNLGNQKPEPTAVGKKWNKAQTGTETGLRT